MKVPFKPSSQDIDLIVALATAEIASIDYDLGGLPSASKAVRERKEAEKQKLQKLVEKALRAKNKKAGPHLKVVPAIGSSPSKAIARPVEESLSA